MRLAEGGQTLSQPREPFSTKRRRTDRASVGGRRSRSQSTAASFGHPGTHLETSINGREAWAAAVDRRGRAPALRSTAGQPQVDAGGSDVGGSGWPSSEFGAGDARPPRSGGCPPPPVNP